MNDLEALVRDALERHEGDAPSFDPADARRAVGRTRRRQIANVAALCIGTIALAIGLIAGVGELVRTDPDPNVGNPPPSRATPAPSLATPAPSQPGLVNGWPDTTRNPPGVYSWDEDLCGAREERLHNSCIVGFMHNGYGSGFVEIRVGVRGAFPDGDVSSTTVAGHDAIYERVGGVETWYVEIEGVPIAIQLEAQPGAGQADLADAHAIVASMRTQPSHNEHGFRLIFTLTNNEWDSG